jgi:hypothetical protein
MYVKQLPIQKQFELYKKIKAYLIECDSFTVENLTTALNSKVNDLF